jgi:tRNA(fMet)-specific endonuclease VapC
VQFLLDTNTCIAAMRRNPQVIQRLSLVSVGDCAISAITAYELFTGVEKCAYPAPERAKVQLLLATVVELPFADDAAREAARIRAWLEVRGQMIGAYDILIAAHAISEQLVLVTHNTAEFGRVCGLTIDDWQVSRGTP